MLSPLYGQLSPLRVPTSMRFISNDADVVAYVLAVEAADGDRLEDGVIAAYDSFVTGCKSDGIWSALKASCILAGARTLSGALVPLVGTAPTNLNFVSGDYNRETGLKGNGSTKRLDAGRNNATDPQNSKHLSGYVTENTTLAVGRVIATNSGSAGLSHISQNTPNTNFAINYGNTLGSNIGGGLVAGFLGATRPSSTQQLNRHNGSTYTISAGSSTPRNETIGVFSRAASTAAISDARISFYSIGEAIDLAALDTRVSTLMTALAAAIT